MTSLIVEICTRHFPNHDQRTEYLISNFNTALFILGIVYFYSKT